MNFVKKIINWFLGFGEKKPAAREVDFTGIVWSDHPQLNNGWWKGVVVGRNKAIIPKHCGAHVGCKIYVIIDGEKCWREVKKVDKLIIESLNAREYYLGGDLTVVTTEDWPQEVKIYSIPNAKIKNKSTVLTLHQDKTFSTRRARQGALPWMTGDFYERTVKPGDSGGAWFAKVNNQIRVVGVTSRGDRGEAADLSDPRVAIPLRKLLENK